MLFNLSEFLKKVFVYLFIFVFSVISIQISKGFTAMLYLIFFSWIALKSKRYLTFLLLITLGTRLGCVFLLDVPITSDWKQLFESSQMFIQGDYSFQDKLYFELHAYQTGLVILNGLFLKIWNNAIFIRLMNVLAQTGIVYIIYQIVKKIFSEKAARVISIGYSLSFFPMTYISVLSNAHFSALFVCITLYILLVKEFKNYFVKYALMGLSMALANAIRPDVLIVNVALLVYFVFQILQKNDKKMIVLQMGIYFGTYLLIYEGCSLLVALLGINSYGLSNQDALYTIAVGTGYENMGLYSDDIINRISAYMNQGMTRNQADWTVIVENCSVGLTQLVGLFINKIKIFWSGEGVWYSLRYLSAYSPLLYSYIQDLDSGSYMIFILMTFISGLCFFFRKMTNQQYLIYFVLFSSFCAYLVLEIATCYSYLTMIFLFIAAAPAIEIILEFIAHILNKLKLQEAGKVKEL